MSELQHVQEKNAHATQLKEGTGRYIGVGMPTNPHATGRLHSLPRALAIQQSMSKALHAGKKLGQEEGSREIKQKTGRDIENPENAERVSRRQETRMGHTEGSPPTPPLLLSLPLQPPPTKCRCRGSHDNEAGSWEAVV